MKEEHLERYHELITHLKDTPTLKFFQRKDLSRMLHFSKIRRYEPEEKIIDQGSYDNWIFFLVSGSVRVVKDDETVDEISRTGDIFGEMCIIDSQARSASIYAIDHVVCLATDVSFIDNLMPEDKTTFSASLYQLLAEILANRLRETTMELVKAREEIIVLKCKSF
jgi:CRP/FNR family cyclic AMP-dependent transcriptional regulator